jgi:hypothetical protein
MEVSGQICASAALPPKKEFPVPIGQEAGWPQSRSGHGSEDKNIPEPRGNRISVVEPVV